MSNHANHTIARYVDAEISVKDCAFGIVKQEAPIVRGDCNVLRIRLLDEPPEGAAICIRFINSVTEDSYGEFSGEVIDGMEITIPNNEGLFDPPGALRMTFSIEADGCKKSSPVSVPLSAVSYTNGTEYTGETGVALISETYAAGEAAQQAAQAANEAAEIVAQLIEEGGGIAGSDGFSPTVEATPITGGTRLMITDANGTQTVDIMDGENGAAGATGADGSDGFSPTVSVSSITGGHRVSVTDKTGTESFDVMDGANGTTPVKGTDYFTESEINDIVISAASEVDALPSSTKYAGADVQNGAAKKTLSIPFGAVDSTSTSTAYTATIDGITELRDGVCVMLKNGVATSAAGCTLNVNNLGAKPIYQT
ncbi:MAG: hypothetical protein IKS19_00975, partial [Clostridia bacterium]|nr:hypothetical protein [Clostridia bacterium]